MSKGITTPRLLLRSLFQYWRTNLGVLLGVAVATTVITGALIIGDSMRYTLQHTADQRLGEADYAVVGGERFFTSELIDGMGPDSTGVIALNGVLATPDGQTVVADVNVYGIDADFENLMPGIPQPAPGEALVNQPLRESLGEIAEGADLVLRVPEPTALPLDASLVNADEPAAAISLQLGATISADEGGRFSLRAEQREPLNIFVDRAWLEQQRGLESLAGRANLALMLEDPRPIQPTLDDLQLELTPLGGVSSQLATDRVFLDASIERDLADLPGTRLLTYLVNTIALGDNESPYAMVCAADGLGDLDLADDEIAINRWLADDLGASLGDELTLTYYLPDEGDRLVEATATLTVARILELEAPYADPSLTPNYPGLAEAETMRRWDPGPAIDRDRIRDEDEDYWDEYRATPKAFVGLATGQALWANRFGTLTAIRLTEPVEEDDLAAMIDHEPLGLGVVDIGAQADDAAAGTVDFGQLFLSLSGFIIIAAVVLLATLFAMSVEQRARQVGALLAMGLTRRRVVGLIMGEGALVALMGALLGLAGGMLYAQLVVDALSGGWSGAIANSPILLHRTPTSLVIGPMSAMVICLVAMLLMLRSLMRRPARELLSGAVGRVSTPGKGAMLWMSGAVLLSGASLYTSVLASTQAGMSAGLTGFGAGTLLFACGIMALQGMMLSRQRRKNTDAITSLLSMSVHNLMRRQGRTLAAVITLGAGVFLVLAISGFRLGVSDDPTNRASGTGGYALIVESTQPIRYDLSTELGREQYGIDEEELPPGAVVPLRVSDGDDASCLNLNASPTPRLLGVDPALLNGSFSTRDVWGELQAEPDNDAAIPVIADANTAQWVLKLAVGDTMDLTDELGRPFTVILVATIENTILQGSLIMHEDAFERLYPGTSGYRMMLIDAEDDVQRDEITALLNDVLVDDGVTITPTTERLAQYNQVQNTYLTIFQALGGLGVALGALGLGVIAARNLFERRAELALLSAVGLSNIRILTIALIEHGLILILGVGLGFGAAALATQHTGEALGGSGQAAWLTMLAVLAAGLIAVVLGVYPAMTGRLTQALRND